MEIKHENLLNRLQVLVGQSFKKFWDASCDPATGESWAEGWYTVRVTEVAIVEGTDVPQLLCRYENGDSEDVCSSDIICKENSNRIDVNSLSADAKLLLGELRQPFSKDIQASRKPHRRKSSQPVRDLSSMPNATQYTAEPSDEPDEETFSVPAINNTDRDSDLSSVHHTSGHSLRKRSAPGSTSVKPAKRRKGYPCCSRLKFGSTSQWADAATSDQSLPLGSPVSTDTFVQVSDGAPDEVALLRSLPSVTAAADSGKEWGSAPSSASTLGFSPPRRAAPSSQKQSQQKWATNKFPGPPQEVDRSRGIGRAGQIAFVHLRDFMCHKNLEIQFGCNVVFISGTNGSGKSAVLNAIQMCLGAQAKSTGRNNKASDFIRTAAAEDEIPPTSAVATVAIWNTGTDAYCHNTFGNKIQVVKTISLNSSKVKLLDQEGKKVAEGKEDLDKLLEFLGVEARNKAVCMSQDLCRSFSMDVSARDKFMLYMEATQMIRTKTAHVITSGNLEVTRACTSEAKKDLKEKKDRLKKIRETLEVLQKVAPLQELDHAVRNCMAWAHVSERRAQEETRKKVLEVDLPERIADAATHILECSGNLASIKEQRNPKVEQLADLEPQITKLTKEQQVAHHDQRQAAKRLHAAKSALVRQRKEADDADAEAANYAEACKEDNQDALSQAANRQFEADLQAARLQVRAAAVAKHTAMQQHQEVTGAKNNAEAESKQATEADAAIGRNLARHRQTIVSLQSRQGNPLTAFGGQQILRIMERIERDVAAGSFHRPPLGPLGALLTLTDEKWAVALEVNCGNQLSSFLVHDMADLKRLKAICRLENMQPPTIVVTSFDHPPHNLSIRPQPPQHVLTMLRVLRVRPGPLEHIVTNFLIDMKLGAAALVEGNSQAVVDFMRQRSNSQFVSTAWNTAGDKAYRRGANETLHHNNRRITPRLTKDLSALLVAERAALQRAEADKSAASAAAQAAAEKCRRADQAYKSATHCKNSAIKHMADSQAAEEDLANAGPDLAGIGVGDAERAHTDGLAQAALLRQEAERCEDSLQQADAEEKRIREEIAQRQRESSCLLETCNILQQDIASHTADHDEQLAKLDQWVQQKAILERKASEVAKTLAQLSAQLQEDIADACQICSEDEGAECREKVAAYLCGAGPAPLPPEAKPCPAAEAQKLVGSTMDLQIQLDIFRSRIDKCMTPIGASLDGLEMDKAQLEAVVARRSTELQVVAANLSLANEGVITRKQRYRDIADATDRLLGNEFRLLCSRRGLLGRITVDRGRETLTIECSTGELPDRQPRGSSAKPSRGALGSLSGGERSLTTLSFALALQATISVPFFCLDEFDVFMDPVNRAMGLRVLLEAAIEDPDRQLILFSPQDTGAIIKALELCKRNNFSDLPDNFVDLKVMKSAKDTGGRNRL